MFLPIARPSVIVQEDGPDFFLVDTDGGEVYQVNGTAARIFTYCKSGATIDSVVAALAEGLPVAGQEGLIREDVEATARRLVELGLCDAAG